MHVKHKTHFLWPGGSMAGCKQGPILLTDMKTSSAGQQDPGKSFTSSSLMVHVLWKKLTSSGFCQKLAQEEKGPRTCWWTNGWANALRCTILPHLEKSDSVRSYTCVPMTWTAGKLKLENRLGPGLAPKYGCRHLVFSWHLSHCESLQWKASLFLPLLLPHEGWTEWAQAACHLLSVG